ncbi:sensor domain-containing diguanylate cyclase [Marinomonas epiphytica]
MLKILSGIQHQQTRRSFVYISTFIFILDILLVSYNYFSAKNTLQADLLDHAKEHESAFELTVRMSYLNMHQLASFIGHQNSWNRLFSEGQKAALEGNKEEEVLARKALLKELQPSWKAMVDSYKLRQLHYHSAPQSVTFLRVHRPEIHSDNLENVRPIVASVNQHRLHQDGFEIGKYYSGLRSVIPIWSQSPNRQQMQHVGALEVGASFEQVLPLYADSYHIHAAVLLNKHSVEQKIAHPSSLQHFSELSDDRFYLDAASSDIQPLLDKFSIGESLRAQHATLVHHDTKYFNVFYFPLYDFQGLKDKLAPVGVVVLWEDSTDTIQAFHKSIAASILIASFGFILVELFLLWIMRREGRLALAEYNSKKDALTGLFNRRYYDDTLCREISRARRLQQPLSLILCDIDSFKEFNDNYGHQAGDRCLQEVANALKHEILRSCDMVARYGGEEFVILLPNTDLNSAIKLAESIRKKVWNIKPSKVTGETTQNRISISIGVACTNELLKDSLLFETADQNLYLAKNSGRNRIEPSHV